MTFRDSHDQVTYFDAINAVLDTTEPERAYATDMFGFTFAHPDFPGDTRAYTVWSGNVRGFLRMMREHRWTVTSVASVL